MAASKTAVEGSRERFFARWWERRKRRAFPAGAISFHLSGWARSRLSQEGPAEAQALLRGWDLEALYVLHGNALAMPVGAALVVLGPPGIGKSRASYALVRKGRARLVEDGLVVVGRRRDRWYVLQTGTVDVLSLASRSSAWLRRLTGFAYGIFLATRVRRSGLGWTVARTSGRVSFALALLLTRGDGRFSPGLLPVKKVVVAWHPAVFRPELRIDRNGGLELVRDVCNRVPESVDVQTVSSVGRPAEVWRRLQRAVLDVSSESLVSAAGS